MNKIVNFPVNLDNLDRGLYICKMDGDIISYDLRMVKPNQPPYMEIPAMHSIVHLFSMFAKETEFIDSLTYFGPMGCRTGYYLLLRDNVSRENVIELVKGIMKKISEYEGEVPSTTSQACANYKEHDLEGAKKEALSYYEVIKNWKPEQMDY